MSITFVDLYEIELDMSATESDGLTWGAELEFNQSNYGWKSEFEHECRLGTYTGATLSELAERGAIRMTTDGPNYEIHFAPQRSPQDLIDLVSTVWALFAELGVDWGSSEESGMHVHVGGLGYRNDVRSAYTDFLWPFLNLNRKCIYRLSRRESAAWRDWCLIGFSPSLTVDSKGNAVTWNASTGGTLEFRLWECPRCPDDVRAAVGITEALTAILNGHEVGDWEEFMELTGVGLDYFEALRASEPITSRYQE